eukprot:CAMPEP_0181228824 /NCGR_PEP_ID=MMETSP1096-20121128/33558_1 /TAXON_ID=156174 ORGANISM="Chrysochromulina ericina, Strain CCMP281" /NCGR_SAMPLE_ID=MMETSP1096 /ASSEMBLY_ACC=CAM_ASM_000453 /LENGTH=186 /DNA_ID=CAMNT_0023322383 /DNA_START=70 /DNA_END=630 /DNA_ORIENTATION=-
MGRGVKLNHFDLDQLFKNCDSDSDGNISYPELVRAMHDVWAPQAAEQALKVGGKKAVSKTGWTHADVEAAEDINPAAGKFGVVASKRFGEAPRILNARQGIQGKTGNLAKAFAAAISFKFKNTLAAFKHMDSNSAGTLTRHKIERALAAWNIPCDKEEVDQLFAFCDLNGDGEVTYDEFLAYVRGQ